MLIISDKKYNFNRGLKRFVAVGIFSGLGLINGADHPENDIVYPKPNHAYVTFKFDSSELDSLDKRLLISTLNELGDTVNVVGYACAVGNSAYNLGLSKRRAEAVAREIKNIDSTKVVNVSYIGETSKFGDDPNRRVDIIGVKEEKDKKEVLQKEVAQVKQKDIPGKPKKENQLFVSGGVNYYPKDELYGGSFNIGGNLDKNIEAGIRINYILGRTKQNVRADTVSRFNSGNYTITSQDINKRTNNIGLEFYLDFAPFKNLLFSAGIGGLWNLTSSNGNITRTMYNSKNEIRDRDIDKISDKVSYSHFNPQASFGIKYFHSISGNLDFELGANYETVNGTSMNSGLKYRFK